MDYGYREEDNYYKDFVTGYAGMYCRKKPDIQGALEPVISKLREYDAIRIKLEQEGGRVSDLKRITDIFNGIFSVRGDYGLQIGSLSTQRSLKEAIRCVDWDLHLDIRQLPTRMPVYYICRTRRDFWAEYSLVVEDIYMSPGYPLTDERFVKLMEGGHEVYYLRLSQFRDRIACRMGKTDFMAGDKIDRLLYGLGRHIFQAAWHEDQRLATLTAKYLGLPEFHNAIELLYLCLSGELCELRGAVDSSMLDFFQDVYPRSAIGSFLAMLGGLEGGTLTELPQKAAGLYKRLSRTFSKFLSAETIWGHGGLKTPIWKLLYANFSRLAQICKVLREREQIKSTICQLEAEARGIISELLDTSSSSAQEAKGQRVWERWLKR